PFWPDRFHRGGEELWGARDPRRAGRRDRACAPRRAASGRAGRRRCRHRYRATRSRAMGSGATLKRSGDDAEVANFFEERLDLGAVGGRSGPREPELVEGVSRILGVLGAEGCGGAGGRVRASGEGLTGGEEELRGAIGGIAFQRFLEQRNGRFG